MGRTPWSARVPLDPPLGVYRRQADEGRLRTKGVRPTKQCLQGSVMFAAVVEALPGGRGSDLKSATLEADLLIGS